MKTTIYYFTGTGNSLKCAQYLAQSLGDTEIIPMLRINEKIVHTNSDCIGLIFPVYIWGIPLIVNEFIKKLSTEDREKYIFAIATNGGAVSGSLLLLEKKLRMRKFTLAAGFSVIMPSNFISRHQTTLEEQTSLFMSANIKLDKIAKIIMSREKCAPECGQLWECYIKTGIIYKIFSLIIHKMDNDFWTDNNCNGCGLCSRICPVNNISIVQGVPKWQNRCEQCYACINMCPKEALQYRKMTKGKVRYRNPYFHLKDFTNK